MSGSAANVLPREGRADQEADPVPTYRLTAPDNSVELLQADSARSEGIHTVLRGTAHVMGRPREVVLRRVPLSVRVAVVNELEGEDAHSWATRD